MGALDVSVLVIGPNKGVQKEIRKALPEADLVFVIDGKAAIAEVKRHEPEVILMDIALPGQDGYEVLQQLHLRESLNAVPVVMISGNSIDAEEFGTDPAALVAKGDFGSLKSRIVKLLAKQAVQKSFRDSFLSVLANAASGANELTRTERSALESADFPLDGEIATEPLAERAARYNAIVASSLTTEEAAKKLGVNTSRVRQRLLAKPPQLYGIRQDNVWHLPAFQFGAKGLVPNIDKVIARLDREIDPVALDTWFRRPNVDLVLVEDDHPVSPLTWLAQGRSFRPVADLAEDL